ncbi:MAG: branched-chain amino acid ABC transporter permease [Clostridiales bacterium]|jgi:branched-chain amino acid transport system permease protein|nr:branched-chain amino acid ABC transporter permease [Clostridiales bacterium]
MKTNLLSGRSTILKFIALIIVIVALFSVPSWGSQYTVMFFMLVCMYIGLGQMWNLLAGYAGLVSLGQQIYIGIGGYALAVLSNYYGVPLFLGLIIGGLVAMLISVGLSYLLLRMKGMYFAVATWITAEALIVIFAGWNYVGSGNGMFIKAVRGMPTSTIYYYSLVVAIITVIIVVFLLRSKLGLGLIAIRDNDSAAETSGVNIFKTKLYCMMISSFLTSVIGGLFYMSQVWVQPYAAFAINWTIAGMFIVVIGGIGTVSGPILGAIIYVFLNQYLSQFGGISMIILGIIAILVILFASKGILGTIQDKFGFEILSARRHSDRTFTGKPIEELEGSNL